MELFTTKDPRGFIVTCTRECWNTHLYTHPEIEGRESEAKKAIESPKHGCIYLSNHHLQGQPPDRHVFYRSVAGRKAELRIVVQFDGENKGIVRSIGFVSRRPEKEYLIWPK